MSGQLERLGVHTLPAKLGVGAGIALAVVAQRLHARDAYLQKLLVAELKPLAELRAADLGAAVSSVAASHLRDGAEQYVERDADGALHTMLKDDRFVLLVGPSGAGKSFTADRVARTVHGRRYALIPPPPSADSLDPTRRDPLTELLKLPPPPIHGRRSGWILWLDDFGEHLANGNVDWVMLRQWIKRHPRRYIVATLDFDGRGLPESGSARARARAIADHACVHEMEVLWSDGEQARVRQGYDVTDEAAKTFAHYCACSSLLSEFKAAAGRNHPGVGVLRAAVDWHRAGMTRPIPKQILRELLPLYLPPRTTKKALETHLERGLVWAQRRFGAPAAFLTEIESTPPSYDMHHVAFDAVGVPPDSGVWVVLHKRLRNPAERVALARAALQLWERPDVARGVLRPIMELTLPGELRREVDELWEQLPHDAGPDCEDRRRLAGERVGGDPPQRRPVASPDGFPPIGWLAAINRNEALKALVRVTSLVLIDLVCVWAALLVAWAALGALSGVDSPDAWTAALDRIPYAMLLVLLLFSRGGLYRPQIRRAHFARVIAALTQGAIGFAALDLLTSADIGPRGAIPLTLVAAVGFVGLGRLVHMRATRWLRKNALGHVPRQVLIGTRRDVRRVKDVLSGPRRGRDLVGWVTLGDDRRDVGDLRCLGHVGKLRALIEAEGLDDLVVCSDRLGEDTLTDVTRAAWLAHAHVRAIAGGRRFLVRASRYAPGEALPLEQLQLPEFEPTEYAIKRTFDIVVSIALLAVTLPIWLIAGLLWAVTRKPVLETRTQPGRGGVHFVVRKFRTTRLDRPDMRPSEPTRIGRVVDRLGIDELPQLLSVLTGTMSLVGPRPISQLDYDSLEPWQRRRNFVPPGITGLWQISERQDEDYGDMVRLDLDYVQRWSLFLDVEILLKSVQVAITGRHATLRTNVAAAEL